VFGLQFQHYRTGAVLHVLWTVRGTRPVGLDLPAGATVTVFDQLDNPTIIRERGGRATVTVSSSPCYVWGLPDNPRVTLGEPDHADAQPAPLARRLGNLGDGSWNLSAARDTDYETVHLEFIKKFPGPITVQPVAAPARPGGRALAVHLAKPDQERATMPFYTSLVPARPIALAGKPSHLGLWARAASDWGRVVYCLRDAQGERWLSVGKKDEWNGYDTPGASAFNFDGWRYLRFELPGNQPWDCFRDAGSTWWGYFGQGDGIVDLPLTLEKIIVERRTHVIKLDTLEPANPADVLLGDLYVEYARDADRSEEAVRLSRVRMGAGAGGQSTGPKAGDYNPFR
jgi:hypothetical protein